MIVIGDEGSTRQRLLDVIAYDSFEGDYLDTIGADIHNCNRSVEGRNVKLVVWELANGFENLRRAYYMNTSMVIITIEKLTTESKQKYLDTLTDVFDITGKLHVALVSDHTLTPSEKTLLDELSKQIDVSQIVTDLTDTVQLESNIDRLLREFLFTNGTVKEPYILSLLRIFGLSDDLTQDRDRAIEVIRMIDKPSDLTKMISGDVLHNHFKENHSSLFIDIGYLTNTEYSVHIPEILEHRTHEIRNTWVNETSSDTMDLRYLWLTAYGFEVLRTLKMPLSVSKAQYKRVEEVFKALGFKLKVRKDGKYPDSKISKELRESIWELVSRI